MTDLSLGTYPPLIKRPFYPAFWHFAMACYFGTLATDITYWKTAEITWANFSAWLLAAGLMMSGLAALVRLIDWLTGRLVGLERTSWIVVFGNLLVVVLSFFNALVHSRDAWTSVVPTGLIISTVAVVLMIAAALVSRLRVYRDTIGVAA